MSGLKFSTPVIVWLDSKNHKYGQRRIPDVTEGMAALHRYGMEALRAEPVWKEATAALARAKLDPSPTNIETARQALVRLADEAGVLVLESSEPQSSPVTELR